MEFGLIFIADLINSKKLASKPGGLKDIHDLCANMGNFLDTLLNHLNYDHRIAIIPKISQGDSIEYQFESDSFQKLADVAAATAIHAFIEGPSSSSFRYLIYSKELGKDYQPRIKVFADLSKTEKGKQFHLAFDQSVSSRLTDTDVIDWLKDTPNTKISLKFTGEPWTGIYMDLYCPISSPRAYSPLPAQKDAYMAEKTYFRYRDEPSPLIESPELVHYLEERYNCTAITLGSKLFPVTSIWENIERLIEPEAILGILDFTDPVPFTYSPTLLPLEYAEARKFIRTKYESGSIKYEGTNYCMTRIEFSNDLPKVHGTFGLYYDNILTQYAIEWELRKALLLLTKDTIPTLSKPGTLLLREAIEAQGNPLINGNGRCTAITISTFLVFKRPKNSYACLIRRRSLDVGVSPGMLHVVPAAMFEASTINDSWSIEINIWRELLEEVYNEKEQQGNKFAESPDHILSKEPIRLLRQMIKEGSAELSVTGLVCDLLNLRLEVCTVLFVADSKFAEARQMNLNWEYLPEIRQGKFLVNWHQIDELLERDGAKYGIVAGGAACLALGRRWVKYHHGI